MDEQNMGDCLLCGKQLDGDVEEFDGSGVELIIQCSNNISDGKATALVGCRSVALHRKCAKFYCFCIICGKDVKRGDVRTVREKGIGTLMNSSEKRCDGKGAAIAGLNSVTVHEKCRKLYTSEKSINACRKRALQPDPVSKKQQDPLPQNDPSDEHQAFDFKGKCLFCAEDITAGFLINERKKKVGKRKVYKIRHALTLKLLINTTMFGVSR